MCCSRLWALQKWLNQLRCRLKGRLWWAKRTMYLMGYRSPQEKGWFCGMYGPLKSITSHCYGICSKKVTTASVWLLQTTALLMTGNCHVNFPREKSAPVMWPLINIVWLLLAVLNKWTWNWENQLQCSVGKSRSMYLLYVNNIADCNVAWWRYARKQVV